MDLDSLSHAGTFAHAGRARRALPLWSVNRQEVSI